MNIEPQFIVFFLLLGSVVGFMAGLLGIGGGGIMVPVLTSLFLAMGWPIDQVVHTALGTTMAAIVMTSFSSLMAHHKRKAVVWFYVKLMSVGTVIGTFAATFIASWFSSLFLAVFFSAFMALVSVQMFLNKKPKVSVHKTKRVHLFMVGNGIGAVSALVSIGGGSLTVPYLVWRSVDVKKAIGTSAAIGLPIAVSGSLGYVINGWNQGVFIEHTWGYVYWPAVLFISMTSVFFAPIGAQITHVFPVPLLKKIFALLLILLSAKMVWSIL